MLTVCDKAHSRLEIFNLIDFIINRVVTTRITEALVRMEITSMVIWHLFVFWISCFDNLLKLVDNFGGIFRQLIASGRIEVHESHFLGLVFDLRDRVTEALHSLDG